jgi:uncharacterized OB-fold protein
MTAVEELSDPELVERFAHAPVDRDNKEFYRGWLAHELRINRCADCGQWHHPPRPMCPSCWSWNVVPTPVSGKGTIHLLMLMHQGPTAPDFDYADGPHPVVAVELEEQPGLRYTSTVVNCPVTDLEIGMPVELTWIERYGAPFPVFQRVQD